MVDDVENLAYSTVAIAPSPDTSGVSLVLQTGDGAKFPAPPFSATAWPSGDIPLESNAEIVRVTGLAGDTVTMTRMQEGTSAQPIAIGYQFAQTLTAAFIAELLASGVTSFNTRTGSVTLSKVDVTNTGLTYSDVNADIAGAAEAVEDEIPAVSATVTGPPAYGDSPVPGAGGFYSDGLHQHGLVAAPIFQNSHTYAISGYIAVPSGVTNYIPPFYEPVQSGTTKTLIAVEYSIRAGTSVSFSVNQNGSPVSGLSALSAITTPTTTAASPIPSVANGDSFSIVVSAVSATPDGLTVSFFFKTVI